MPRSALHRAGAAALIELLQFEPPTTGFRSLAPAGTPPLYKELRSKLVMTVVGPVRISRPYYLCTLPTGAGATDASPGGHQAPFDHGREQMQLLAGLEVTTKAVERTAEAIGEDIAARQQQEIQRAMLLDLPIVVGAPIPILYVQTDATGVPVVKKKPLAGKAR